MPPLRKIGGKFPHAQDKLLTLIDVNRSLFAVTVKDKKELLQEVVWGNELIAVWTGQYSSHAFEVTDLDLALFREQLAQDSADQVSGGWSPSHAGQSGTRNEKRNDMARIRVEVTEGQGGWTPIPDGTYEFEINEVKQGNAGSGTPSIGVVSEVTSGPAAGKKSTFWFYQTPKAGFRTRQLLEATGCPFEAGEKTDEGEILEFDTDDLLTRRFTAQIKIDEHEGKQNNKIVKFVDPSKMAGTKPASPPKTAPAVAPKAAAAPPKGAPPPRAKA